MKPVQRKKAKKQPVVKNHSGSIPTTRRGDLPVMRYDNKDDKSLLLLADELNRIPPGFGSSVLFNCGTFRQTLSAIDKAIKGKIGKDKPYRFGKDFWNGAGVFKGITVHRYNISTI